MIKKRRNVVSHNLGYKATKDNLILLLSAEKFLIDRDTLSKALERFKKT